MVRLTTIILMLMSSVAAASALPASLAEAKLRGEATFRFLGIPLYDARLYTKNGAALDWDDTFGVELTYRKNLTRYDLVESTMRELDRTGSSLSVRAKLETCFNDVKKGDQFLAVSNGPNEVGFWFNGQKSCALSHPDITQRFMGIFLGENTRSKAFTRKLKGN